MVTDTITPILEYAPQNSSASVPKSPATGLVQERNVAVCAREKTGFSDTRLTRGTPKITPILQSVTNSVRRVLAPKGGNEGVSPRALRGNEISSGLDYLKISCPEMSIEQLRGVLRECYAIERFELEPLPSKGGFKLHTMGGVYGFLALIDPEMDLEECGGKDDLPYEVVIEARGEFFEGLTAIDAWNLVRNLKRWGIDTCNRVDIRIDDNTYHHIPLADMMDAFSSGANYGFRKVSDCGERIQVKSAQKVQLQERRTYYFGSRHSGRLGRVYSHRFSDNSESLRLETEFKRNQSRDIFGFLAQLQRPTYYQIAKGLMDNVYGRIAMISENMDEIICMDAKEEMDAMIEAHSDNPRRDPLWDYFTDERQEKSVARFTEKILQEKVSMECWETILQKILNMLSCYWMDFRERRDKKASKRDSKRLGFWSSFLKKLGGIEIRKIPQTERYDGFAKTEAWMERQCARTLSIMRDGFGATGFRERMERLIDNGRHRRDKKDNLTVRHLKYGYLDKFAA